MSARPGYVWLLEVQFPGSVTAKRRRFLTAKWAYHHAYRLHKAGAVVHLTRTEAAVAFPESVPYPPAAWRENQRGPS